jgi:DNA polymerase-3 subunit epsilon
MTEDEDKATVIYQDPDDKALRARVDAARAHLAELETRYTIEKAKVDGLQARLFSRLRPHHQERERLRLIVTYRRQFLDALLKQGEKAPEDVHRKYHEERARSDREYEQAAAAMAAKKRLTGEEEVDISKLWKQLVKLYHPDRFAYEPEKLETYGKLTDAINRAKDSGDLNTLRQIANDPHAFILKHGWTSLDFRDEEQIKRLRNLLESLEAEIRSVQEAHKRLRESPELALHAMIEEKPEMFDTVVAKQIDQLEAENAELAAEARQLAQKIETLTDQEAPGT